MNQLSLKRKKTIWILGGVSLITLLIASVGLVISYIERLNAPTLDQLLKEDEPQLLARLSEKGIGVPTPTTPDEPKLGTVQVKEAERSAADVAIVNEWFSSVGYSPEGVKAYSNYSDQVLEDLIARGDIIAMAAMSSRKLESQGSAAARPYSERGIIYGSLHSIKSMSIYTEPVLSEGVPYNANKAQLKESFAYLALLAMRGDSYKANHSRSINMEIFEKYYNVKKPLTAEDEAWIQTRAKELYDHYQTERNKLGLGNFDNETPKEVKDFFGVK